jgi:hypothetical protein
MYAYESIVHFNMLAESQTGRFIVASLQKYDEMFLHGAPLRYSTDKQLRQLCSDELKVLGRLFLIMSKLSFM